MEASCLNNENVYEIFEKIIDSAFIEKLNEGLIDKKINEINQNEELLKKK